MLKSMFAVAAITLMSGAAIAGEGQGNPFPFQAPTQPYSLQAYKQSQGASQNPYPFTVPGTVISADPVVRPVGSAGEVQSVASLPVGALDGTAQGQNLRHITPSSTQIAEPQLPRSRVPG